MMKLFRNEEGQTLVFTALLMCCLMGLMAISMDVGVLFRAQRKLQTAADAAAVAGTLEYFYHGSANAKTVAKTAAKVPDSQHSGITDAMVTVNMPPANVRRNPCFVLGRPPLAKLPHLAAGLGR